jgi:hypothetical protein
MAIMPGRDDEGPKTAILGAVVRHPAGALKKCPSAVKQAAIGGQIDPITRSSHGLNWSSPYQSMTSKP